MLKQPVLEGLHSMVRTQGAAGEEHEETGAAESKCYELGAMSIPRPLAPLG